VRDVRGTIILMSDEILYDGWYFEPGDTWDKNTWGKKLEQGAPATVSRGGLPLPVVTATSVAPPSGAAVSIRTCAIASDNSSSMVHRRLSQVFEIDSNGMLKLKAAPALCLSSNASGVFTSGCDANQEFLWVRKDPGAKIALLQLKSAPSPTCIEFDCNVSESASDQSLFCSPNDHVVLAPCNATSPKQLVDYSYFEETGELSLAPGVKVNAKANGGCIFDKLKCSSTIRIDEGDGLRATVVNSSRGSLVMGTCPAANYPTAHAESSSPSTVFSFSFVPSTLNGEVFIGIAQPSSKLSSWVNTGTESYGYGSHGILGSNKGYKQTWSDSWKVGG
jgi:hypothetical protein